MRKKTILAIFTSLTILILSGCASVPPPLPHPDLMLPKTPPLPKFTREMLDCRRDNLETLPLCIRIKEREAVLQDHIETQDILVNEHNEALKK